MHDYNNDGYIDRDEAFTLYEDDPISDEQIERELDGVRSFKKANTRACSLTKDALLKTRTPSIVPTSSPCLQTFGVMDVDKDGKMSYKEFSRFFERAVRNKPLLPELTGE
jgi:Ca2+-binding EF-hand superfamily protein